MTTISPAAIVVDHLSKVYRVPEREAGLMAGVRSLVGRRFREVPAVRDIAFAIAAGEVVGFLGPNGAGKTTTIKMLAGLLHPSDGRARVLGFEPARREREYLRQMTLVMGNRNQLAWDLPALDSFDVARAMYRIPRERFLRTRDAFIRLLDLDEVVRKPVRNLSLGERMKVEIAASLLHLPKVLFLDEPTIGLDVAMQRRIRAFIAEYNQRVGATVLLTSHYMADVQALCRRVIIIHRGRLLFDGPLADLIARFASHKQVGVTLANGAQPSAASLASYGTIVEVGEGRFALSVPKADVPAVTARLLADWPIADLSVDEPSIEDVIERVFAGGDHDADGAAADAVAGRAEARP